MANSKNLKDAIAQAASYVNRIAEEASISHRITVADKMILEQFVQDFLSQVFSSARLQAHNKQCEQEMDQIWNQIIGKSA